MNYIDNILNKATNKKSYRDTLELIQKDINVITDNKEIDKINNDTYRASIFDYLQKNNINCLEIPDINELLDNLYHDTKEYSFITREKLFERDGFEEININSWQDIFIKENGKEYLSRYRFDSPKQAMNILKRMLRHNGLNIDESKPLQTADLGSGIRITAAIPPIVDESIGVTASIRKVNTSIVSEDFILGKNMLTYDMMFLLKTLIGAELSIILSGATGSGKTSLGGILLGGLVDQGKRLFTIEEGAREWDFVKRDSDGKVLSNVIHTKTRPSDNREINITQAELVKASLRYDPDYISPSEVRGEEAFEVLSVANTGHGVLTTLHTNGVYQSPRKMVTLAKKAFAMDDNTLFEMISESFRILVHCKLFKDGVRRVCEIAELCGYENGKPIINMLYTWEADDTIYDDDGKVIQMIGDFKKVSDISPTLIQELKNQGVPKATISKLKEMV